MYGRQLLMDWLQVRGQLYLLLKILNIHSLSRKLLSMGYIGVSMSATRDIDDSNGYLLTVLI